MADVPVIELKASGWSWSHGVPLPYGEKDTFEIEIPAIGISQTYLVRRAGHDGAFLGANETPPMYWLEEVKGG